MKINKRDPAHWLALLEFFLQAFFGLLVRLLRWSPHDGQTVVFYGHKLNGNLLALHDYLRSNPGIGLRPVFLSMDAAYCRELAALGVDCVWAGGMDCSRILAGATALVSDHGLHSLQPLLTAYQRLGLRFFDVWHGIPFKGFDAQDFRLQRHYDETWVASELCQTLYVNRFGFDPARVRATGYPRTDRLVQPAEDPHALRAALGLPKHGKLILFAPTWEQDVKGRSIYPFGHGKADFLLALSTLVRRHGATVLLRSHLNSGNMDSNDDLPPGILIMPGSRYPDTESILLISDVLVCDWSSIAFDYLLLERPTLFLDVPPPFRKGFSLGPEYRFGSVVADLQALLHQLEICLSAPDDYWRLQRTRHETSRHQIYGSMADGHSSQRCVERMVAYIRLDKKSSATSS